MLRKPDLELRLQAENNKAIAEYRKAVEDYPKMRARAWLT